MKIEIRKFGNILISRPSGREACQVVLAYQAPKNNNETIEIDFAGVKVLTPSWFDEFITNMAEHFSGRVELLPTDNASVRAMLPVLAMERHDAAANVLRRAMKAMSISLAQ